MLVSCINLKKMERYLRVNLLGPGPLLMKKKLLGCRLTKVEKHCPRRLKHLSYCKVWDFYFIFTFLCGTCSLKQACCSFNHNVTTVSTSLYVSNLFLMLK